MVDLEDFKCEDFSCVACINKSFLGVREEDKLQFTSEMMNSLSSLQNLQGKLYEANNEKCAKSLRQMMHALQDLQTKASNLKKDLSAKKSEMNPTKDFQREEKTFEKLKTFLTNTFIEAASDLESVVRDARAHMATRSYVALEKDVRQLLFNVKVLNIAEVDGMREKCIEVSSFIEEIVISLSNELLSLFQIPLDNDNESLRVVIKICEILKKKEVVNEKFFQANTPIVSNHVKAMFFSSPSFEDFFDSVKESYSFIQSTLSQKLSQGSETFFAEDFARVAIGLTKVYVKILNEEIELAVKRNEQNVNSFKPFLLRAIGQSSNFLKRMLEFIGKSGSDSIHSQILELGKVIFNPYIHLIAKFSSASIGISASDLSFQLSEDASSDILAILHDKLSAFFHKLFQLVDESFVTFNFIHFCEMLHYIKSTCTQFIDCINTNFHLIQNFSLSKATEHQVVDCGQNVSYVLKIFEFLHTLLCQNKKLYSTIQNLSFQMNSSSLGSNYEFDIFLSFREESERKSVADAIASSAQELDPFGVGSVLDNDLREIESKFREVCEKTISLLFSILEQRCFSHLSSIHELPSWSIVPQGGENSDASLHIPSFSLVPQEYATQLGQYLLSLPHLFDNCSFKTNQALRVCFDFCKNDENPSSIFGEDSTSDLPKEILTKVVKDASNQMIRNLKLIKRLSKLGRLQLVTDVHYFVDILEDLTLLVPSSLSHFFDLISQREMPSVGSESTGAHDFTKVLIKSFQTYFLYNG